MRRERKRAQLFLAGLLSVGCPLTTEAFTLFAADGSPFSDVLANPNDHNSWDSNTITYTFSKSFDITFPDPRIKDQIRWALSEWSRASTIGYGTNFGYQSNDIALYGEFADIRSVTLHELGHALGFNHPNQGADANLNFIPIPDGGVGGTLTQVDYDNGASEVMYSALGSGEYSHILTWDELDAYNFIYGSRVLTFTEVASGANIDFSTIAKSSDNLGTTTTLSHLRNSDPLNGGVIVHALIVYNIFASNPIGFSSHMINWSITCNTLKTHSVRLRTSGTDNVNPLAWANNDTPYVFFGSAAIPPLGTPVGPDSKNDITWNWVLPGSSAATDIPAGTVFHPGLALDVDDWVAVNCTVFDFSGANSSDVPITVADEFEFGLVTVPPNPSMAGHGALTYVATVSNSLCAIGFSIIATETPQTTISDLKFADVTDRGLGLSNLNAAGLEQLEASNLVATATNFGVHVLGSRGQFFVVLQGSPDCLPLNAVTNGNYVVLNRADLLGKQLFLSWQSTNPENTVQNYAFVGEPPVTGLPALSIEAQGSETNGTVRLSWPQPSAGFVLQQNGDLSGTNWVDVPNPPAIGISPLTGVAENQVNLSQTNQMYYRLIRRR